ncbi:DExH-box ATP-dependent RNA helicase DExH16, mitochondrial [Vitis vinifera]|uniref:DExH-box ATP-dependent RNA helicase DExH16, mitochondrial n=1 Tax=Vitis vinifera TaxID=29760 RepID=A0A438KMD6_VITVI|nr:DExH-box ATP-dependent RNA helicase DExH16, mitochondrial [Vitis vinifera]
MLKTELILSGLQATMFNDATSEFDVLVASDAIGMGLNLNISRIIFSTLKKFDGNRGAGSHCTRDQTNCRYLLSM